MHSMLLTSDKDPMGAAIIDYLAHGKASKLRVFSVYSPPCSMKMRFP